MDINNLIQESIQTKQNMLKDEALLLDVQKTCNILVEAFTNDNKVLLCGNGGSASDAQHFAAELSGRFYLNRDPLFAEALHVNTSYITAVANDYSFDAVYQRLVNAFGRKNDVLIAISTSGNSQNIINAVLAAKTKGMTVIGFTGKSGGKMAAYCDVVLRVPSDVTPRIQEAHILLAHIICEITEKTLFAK